MSLFSLNRLRRWLPVRQDLFGRGSGGYSNNDLREIERMWKKFNARLARLFGRKGKDPYDGRHGNTGRRRRGRTVFVLFVLLLLVVWLCSGIFIVQEGETAVVMTFGRYSHMTSSGINWRYPTPVQSHEVVNVSQVRTVEMGYRSSLKNKQPREALMLTNDENIVDIQFAVQYRLKSAADWVFNNRDQEEMVRQIAEASMREIVGRNKMDFVLYEGRDQIALDTHGLMQEIFDQYRAGVQVTNVTMQGVQPPEQVQAAFDDAVKAGQDRERQKNEGEAYANGIIPRAKGTASRLLQEAEGYRDKVVANAEGNASRFSMVVEEYKKSPVVTRDRMYIETMQEIFSNVTKLMMDVRGGNNLLYLPFDKLISQATASASESQEKASSSAYEENAPAASPQQPDSAPPRARESRDRGKR
ncbi:MAG: FtsH protease activity modulator HflK [Burkholderiaceae bacterium]|jgi:membrane protease subunit HflK|nr:FtsH protease activity modulator HflK [Burkholderiaceae bacterium]